MQVKDGFFIKIFRKAPASDESAAKMAIVIKEPYEYLSDGVRRVFDRYDDIEVLVDRRNPEWQCQAATGSVDRRREDRRGPKDTIMEVIILSDNPG